MLTNWILLAILRSYAVKIVEYRFGYNFGEKFHDFSGNGLHGVNGQSSTTSTYDTIATDRGAHFADGLSQITLPSNDLVPAYFSLPTTFTIAAWVLILDTSGFFDASDIFTRYKGSNNYFYIRRLDSLDMVSGHLCYLGTSTTQYSNSGSLLESNNYSDQWSLIGVVVTGITLKVYINLASKVTISGNSYVESGNYDFYIGSQNSFKGFMWYFVITDDSTFQSSLYSSTVPSSCLTSSCVTNTGATYNCPYGIVDPYAGTGCISIVSALGKDARNIQCPTSGYGCTSLTSLICTCEFLSCVISGSSNLCWCSVGSVANTLTCVCDSGFYYTNDMCCENSCATCNSGESKCLTCIANNAVPDIDVGCKCNNGYYGIKPLSTISACTICYTECSTCVEASKCTACKSEHTSISSTQECVCNDGYWGTAPLILSTSCSLCYAECATCNRNLICITCISYNASPSQSQGCTCNIGYYGGSGLILSDSCIRCYLECSSCIQDLVCTNCISLNAFIHNTQGCRCSIGYWGTAPLILTDSCIVCNADCTTCEQNDLCLTCKDANAHPDTTEGCKCNEGYWGISPLNSSNSCFTCYNECATCSTGLICNTCISDNAYPDGTVGCKCTPGYYATGSLTSLTSCTNCYNECATCSSSLLCKSCISENAYTDSIQGCHCNEGYYALGPLNSPSFCISCHEECSSCIDSNLCVTCIDSNAEPDVLQGCNCIKGYWGTGNNDCTQCFKECTTCSEALLCTECISENSNPSDNGGCLCKSGYYSIGELTTVDACILCTDTQFAIGCKCHDYCLTCYGLNFYECSSCKYAEIYGVCLHICPLGFINFDTHCLEISDSEPTVELLFDNPNRVFQDSYKNFIDISSTVKNISSPDSVYLRGAYFSGNSSILLQANTEQMVFNIKFSISFWINPQSPDGFILYKNAISEKVLTLEIASLAPSLEITIENVTCMSSSNIKLGLNSWNHILLVIDYSDFSSSYFTINSLQGEQVYLSDFPFIDSNYSSLLIGCDSTFNNFYSGLLYELQIFPIIIDYSLVLSTTCDLCSICPLNGKCISPCSLNSYYSNTEDTCIGCLSECSNGCINSNDCNLCADEFCTSCSSFNTFSCTECEIGFEMQNSICIACNSTSYYDFVTRTCRKCEGLCKTCLSSSACVSCIENSSIYSESKCKCDKGYTENGICERNLFNATLMVFANNTARVIFSEDLDHKLGNTELSVEVNSNSVEFTIVLVDMKDFNIEATVKSDITKSSEIKIYFSQLISNKNSLLATSILTSELYQSDSYTQAQVLKEKIAAAKELASAGSTIGASLTVSFSIINFDPSHLFNFMNVAELYYFTSLFNFEIDPILTEFLSNLKVISKLPNIYSHAFNSDNGVKIPENFNIINYKSNLIFLNSGVQLTTLSILVGVFIIIWSLWKANVLRKKLSILLGYFQYGIFLKFWIQSFLEMLNAAIVDVLFPDFNSIEGCMNFGISVLVIVFQGFAVFYLVLIVKRRTQLKDGDEIKAFVGKVGTFFNDFNEKGLSCWLYFVIFVSRRVVLTLCIHFVEDKALQLSIFFVFSLSVISIQSSFYVLCSQCFKSRILNILHFLNDLCLAIFSFILFICLLPENDSNKSNTNILINLVTISWGFNIGFGMIISIVNVITFIKKKLAERKNKVIPFNSQYNVNENTFPKDENRTTLETKDSSPSHRKADKTVDVFGSAHQEIEKKIRIK